MILMYINYDDIGKEEDINDDDDDNDDDCVDNMPIEVKHEHSLNTSFILQKHVDISPVSLLLGMMMMITTTTTMMMTTTTTTDDDEIICFVWLQCGLIEEEFNVNLMMIPYQKNTLKFSVLNHIF